MLEPDAQISGQGTKGESSHRPVPLSDSRQTEISQGPETVLHRKASSRNVQVHAPASLSACIIPSHCVDDRKYTYQPLSKWGGRIRILELCLSSENHLCCKIRHVSLAWAEFSALSYVWGSAEKPFAITVLDQDDRSNGQLPLTSSLRNALVDLWRCPEIEPKIFWIDQICINQDDDLERSRQVQSMGDIYSKATQVITYLGPRTANDDAAIELINKIYEHFEPNLEQFAHKGFLFYLGNLSSLPVSSKPKLNTEKDTLTALMDIVFGEWTRRVWMVQENYLNLNTTCLRGYRTVDSTAIAYIPVLMHINLLEGLHRELQKINPQFEYSTAFSCVLYPWENKITSRFRTGSDSASKLSLVENVVIYSGLRCSDPRDRIFAFLAISSDGEELGIESDYSKSVAEVLINASTSILHKMGSHALKWLSEKNDLDDASTPSWSMAPQKMHLSNNIPIASCLAHPIQGAKIQFNATGKILLCKGRVIDEVLFASRTVPAYGSAEYPYHDGGRNFPESYNYFQAILFRIDKCQQTIKEALSDLLPLILVDRVLSDEDVSAFALILSSDWSKEPQSRKNQNYGSSEMEKIAAIHPDLEHLALMMKEDKSFIDAYNARASVDRKFGFSMKGRSFNSNRKTEKGDKIAILQGSRRPYVLRPCPGKDSFQIVGDIWLHGVMQGELYENVNPDDLDYEIRIE